MAQSRTGPIELENGDAETTTLEIPTTISFNSNGVPDKLIVYLIGGAALMMPDGFGVQAVPIEITALQPGDTSTVTVDPVTYTVTVREAAYRPTEARIAIDVSATWNQHVITNSSYGDRTGESVNTQVLTMTRVDETDGPRLRWQQTIEGTSHSDSNFKFRYSDTVVNIQTWAAEQAEVTGLLVPTSKSGEAPLP